MPEQIDLTVSPEEYRLALVGFIARTSAFEAAFKQGREKGEFPAHVLRFIGAIIGEDPSSVVARSRQVINESLAGMGGIQHYVDDSASGQRIPCRLLSWHGNDTTRDGWHLWRVDVPNVGIREVTIAASLLDELFQPITPNTVFLAPVVIPARYRYGQDMVEQFGCLRLDQSVQ